MPIVINPFSTVVTVSLSGSSEFGSKSVFVIPPRLCMWMFITWTRKAS